MCECTDNHSPRVETGLEMLFTTPVPDAAFVAGLERQLVTREGFRRGGADQVPWCLSWRRWRVAALILVLVLVVTVVVAGPQEVWASLQRLLGGYVPGLGFVNLEQAWMLPEPVEASREGVTVRVEHVVASADGTVVQFSTVEGIRHLLFPVSEWKWDYGQASDEFEAFLRLPDARGGCQDHACRGRDIGFPVSAGRYRGRECYTGTAALATAAARCSAGGLGYPAASSACHRGGSGGPRRAGVHLVRR